MQHTHLTSAFLSLYNFYKIYNFINWRPKAAKLEKDIFKDTNIEKYRNWGNTNWNKKITLGEIK